MIRKAFTLIELLVVISIIGILVTLAFASFTQSQKQARDVRRKSDLKQYQTSLEAFANKNNLFLYPSFTGVPGADDLCFKLGVTGICPTDPKADQSYHYLSDGVGDLSPDATQYVLWAELEGSAEFWVVCSNGKTGQVADEPNLITCTETL